MESLLVSQDTSREGFEYFLVDARQVSTNLAYQPFFASFSLLTVAISAGLTSTQLQGGVGLDDGRFDHFYDLNFDLRLVGTGTHKQPLVASYLVAEIADATKTQRGIRAQNLEGIDTAEELLARVQRERVLFEANFLVAKTEFDVAVVVLDGGFVLTSHHGVFDDAVVARRNHNHSIGASHYFLVIETCVRVRTYEHAGGVRVVVQNVDVVVRFNTNDVGVRHA